MAQAEPGVAQSWLAKGAAFGASGLQSLREGAAAAGEHAKWAHAEAQKKAEASGVKDYAQWAASKSLEKGSAGMAAAKAVLDQQLKNEFGDDCYDMFEALGKCSNDLSQQLELNTVKFGLHFAMPLVMLQHETLPMPRCTKELRDLKLIKEMHNWLDFAAAAYGSDPTETKKLGDQGSVQKALGEEKGQVLMANLPAKGAQSPGHFVAVCKSTQFVVLGVRGTSSAGDAITDAVGHSVPFDELPGVMVHKGVLESAREVIKKVRPSLEAACGANRGFTLMVTGHSLGAAAAIVCALLLKAKPVGQSKIRCYAFAPPPVVSPADHASVKAVDIITVINRNDVVPRASLSNIFNLGLESKAVDGMDMGLMDRIDLARNGSTLEAEESRKQQVVSAVKSAAAKIKEKQKEFPPLFVPGQVFWIEWPEPLEPGMPQPAQKIWYSDCNEFQALVLRGGMTAVKDHLTTAYDMGISGCQAELQTQQSACSACSSCSIM